MAVRAAFLLVFCLAGSQPSAATALDDLFRMHDARGTIVLERLSDGKRWVHDADRAATRFIPASTFKIPHTVFALHSGVVSGPQEVFRWDGTRRSIAAWNRDQNLGEALKNSAVPVYQQIARRIGVERMRALLEQAGYGNRETGEQIDNFWLRGPLRISPDEQIGFLKRLYARQLPFSRQAQETTIALLVDGQGGDWTLRAKTGWEIASEPAIGWYVGWLEEGGDVIFFALNIDMTQRAHRNARRAIAVAVLERLTGRALR